MSAAQYSLKVNRDLLNPQFESYRLSLDAIPTYNVELDAAVEEVKLTHARYTLEHVRAFGMYNYLHLDPWYEESVLFVDSKGRVLCLTVTLDTALGKPREVFRLPEDLSRVEDRVCPSVSLTSATWAALSNGCGRLYLLRTGKRGDSTYMKWEPLFSEDIGGPFTVLHSVSHVQDGVHTMEVLLLHIKEDLEETKGSGYVQVLEWITVGSTAGQGQEKTYEVKKRRFLRGRSLPEYAALEPQGKGLMLASNKPFVFTDPDGRPVEQPEPEPMEEVKPDAEVDQMTEERLDALRARTEEMQTEAEAHEDPIYFWQQTSEDITVTVRMPQGATKGEVRFALTPDNISVGVQGFAPLLEGQLHESVDPEGSTWIVKDDKSLEVTLQKRTEGPMWPELVPGDRSGEQVISDEQAALIHQRLAHLTSDELDPNPGANKLLCNTQELEDCDMPSEQSFSLMYFDGDSLKPTHVVNLATNQYLFTVSVNPSEMPCICLRHDVDGLVWQPRPKQPDHMLEHIATFNALGFVKASKREKFASCAPDFSYASLCDCVSLAFIYRQPAPLETVLFNRKQGRQVSEVAKQQVARLDSDEQILGFRATNERLFALTATKLFVLKVNNN